MTYLWPSLAFIVAVLGGLAIVAHRAAMDCKTHLEGEA